MVTAPGEGGICRVVVEDYDVQTYGGMLRLNPAARSMTPSPSSEPADQRL